MKIIIDSTTGREHYQGMEENKELCTCISCLFWHVDYPNLSDRLRVATCEFVAPSEYDLEVSLRATLAANYIMMGVDADDALEMERTLNS